MAGEDDGSSEYGLDYGFRYFYPQVYDRPYQLVLNNVLVQEDEYGVMCLLGDRANGSMFANGNLYWHPLMECGDAGQPACPVDWDAGWHSWDPEGLDCLSYTPDEATCNAPSFGLPLWSGLHRCDDSLSQGRRGACFTLANVIAYMEADVSGECDGATGWEADGIEADPGIVGNGIDDSYAMGSAEVAAYPDILYYGTIHTDEDFPMPCDMIRRVYRGAIVPDPEVVAGTSIDTTATYDDVEWYDPMQETILEANVVSGQIAVTYAASPYTSVATIPVPEGAPENYTIIDSMEPFVAGGHSYLSIRVKDSSSDNAEIWVVKVPDPDAPEDCFATMRCDTLDNLGTGNANTAIRSIPRVEVAATGEIFITYRVGSSTPYDDMQCNTGIFQLPEDNQVFVKYNGAAGADGSLLDPFATIQEGINAANEGGTVFVMNGTYEGTGNYDLDFDGKAITVRSLDGPSLVFIDGATTTGETGFIFDQDEGADSVVEGFTIQNMDTRAFYLDDASPTIRNCKIQYCVLASGSGGGLYATGDCSPVLEDCTFQTNYSSVNGGAAFFVISAGDVCEPIFDGCVFSQNVSAAAGGAIFCPLASNATFRSCEFTSNQCAYVGGAFSGGDVYFIDCEFDSNSAYDASGSSGGAVVSSGSYAIFTNCHLHDNSAAQGGAVIATNMSLTNCLLDHNEATSGNGGALNVGSQAALIFCTLANNLADDAGGAISHSGGTGGSVSISYSIFAGNTATVANSGDVALFGTSSAYVGFSYLPSTTFYRQNGNTVIASDVTTGTNPGFVGSGDYHLTASTPAACIDVIEVPYLTSDTYDLDGDGDTEERLPDLDHSERVQGSGADMGPYEYE